MPRYSKWVAGLPRRLEKMLSEGRAKLLRTAR